MKTIDRYIFWLNDPTVLYSNGNYLIFFPTVEMTRVEQLNAITRFCIYLLILSLITNKSNLWIQIPIVIIIFVIIVYKMFEYDSEGKAKEST